MTLKLSSADSACASKQAARSDTSNWSTWKLGRGSRRRPLSVYHQVSPWIMAALLYSARTWFFTHAFNDQIWCKRLAPTACVVTCFLFECKFSTCAHCLMSFQPKSQYMNHTHALVQSSASAVYVCMLACICATVACMGISMCVHVCGATQFVMNTSSCMCVCILCGATQFTINSSSFMYTCTAIKCTNAPAMEIHACMYVCTPLQQHSMSNIFPCLCLYVCIRLNWMCNGNVYVFVSVCVWCSAIHHHACGDLHMQVTDYAIISTLYVSW